MCESPLMAGTIGNITAVVNGYITAIPEIADRSYYRSMLAEVLQRVEARLRAVKMSAASASAAAGLSKDAIRNMQRAARTNPDHGVSTRTISALAPVLNTTIGWLMTGDGDPSQQGDTRIVPNFLSVRHRVQAGTWYEQDHFIDELPASPQPVAPDPRFAEWPQWLEEVVGDSINLKIAPGGFAHVVDAVAMGYAPRDGDWVVVERCRFGGGLCERTIKQISMGQNGVELWPRSTNPKWSAPVVIGDGLADEEDAQVAIVGLVIGAYSAFI